MIGCHVANFMASCNLKLVRLEVCVSRRPEVRLEVNVEQKQSCAMIKQWLVQSKDIQCTTKAFVRND